MKNKKWDYFIICLRWLAAAIFIFAGIGKILDPTKFVVDIDNYRMLPYILVTIVAVALPWLEVLCGLFLIFGKWQKSAALILLILSFIFFIAIGSALIRGLDISCGCFTVSEEGNRIGLTKLFQNIVLVLITVLICKNLLVQNSDNIKPNTH